MTKKKKLRHKKKGLRLAAGLFVFTGFVLLAVSCSGAKESEKVDKGSEENTMFTGKDPMFFTESNPGKWEDKTIEHLPELRFVKRDKAKLLQVRMNMQQESNHYIEALVLLDYQRNEKEKINFERGPGGFAQAEFFLGVGKIAPTWHVVAKCNKHDMWQKSITLDSSQYE